MCCNDAWVCNIIKYHYPQSLSPSQCVRVILSIITFLPVIWLSSKCWFPSVCCQLIASNSGRSCFGCLCTYYICSYEAAALIVSCSLLEHSQKIFYLTFPFMSTWLYVLLFAQLHLSFGHFADQISAGQTFVYKICMYLPKKNSLLLIVKLLSQGTTTAPSLS